MLAILRRKSLRNIGISLLLTVNATAFRQIAVPLLGPDGYFLFHLLAIVISSEFVGRTAGLVTTAFCIAALAAQQPHEYRALILLALIGAAISFEGERRRRTRRELSRTHHNLDAAQRLANLGSWESDLAGGLWWSPETYHILGVRPGTLVSRNDFHDLIHPDDRAIVRNAVAETARTGTEYNVEHRIIRKSDGEVRHIHQRGQLVRERSRRLIGSIQDVTEIRANDRDLRRARERLALKHDIARMGTYEWVVQENRVEWSPEMEKLYGIASGSHVHTFDEWMKLVHPDDLAPTLATMQNAVDSRQPTLDATYRIVRPDGEIVWIHSRGKYEYDTGGRATRMLGVNMDITELKRATDQVEQANRVMALALEAGNSGASAWDLETDELTWTASYCRLIGLATIEQPSPELFYSRVHRDDLDRVKASVVEAVDGRANEFQSEFRIVRPDGIRWIERRGRIFRNAAGKPVQMVSISTDITERKILRGLLPTCAQCKKI